MLRIKQNQQGVSLIEALVSLFLFSIGALGIAALSTTALVRTDDTKQRSIAIWKAQELVDRIRSTKTSDNPLGLIDAYITEIDNDNSDDGIGDFDANDEFSCPNNPPTRCDDQNGTAATSCTAVQLVEFDVWSTFCDPNTGIVSTAPTDGAVGLRSLEVSLEETGDHYRLYFEWLSRSANNDLDLQNDDGSARTIVTNLCGDNENVDSRLDVYCVRFQ